MPETTDTTVEQPETPSLRARLVNKKNAKRAAVIGGVAAAALYLKKRLNASGSVTADVHVESDDSDNN